MSRIGTLLCVLSLIFVAPPGQALTPPHPTHELHDLLILPNGDSLLRHSHGVFRRTQAGTGWKQVLEAQRIHLLLAHQNEVYAASFEDLYFSNDYGATWTKREAHHLDSIGDDGTLYGCTAQGDFASKDRGLTWQALDRGHSLPRTAPFLCAGIEHTVRHKGKEYTIDRDNRLYSRSGPGERWIKRQVENNFSPNDSISGIHVDRNGVLYLNVVTVDRSDANAHWPRRIYLSRDGGELWEELSWNQSRIKPVDPQIWGTWNSTLLMTCEMPGKTHDSRICESSDSNPNSLVFRAEVFRYTLIGAPDGAIYNLDRYGIERLGPGDENWQQVDLEGVPDGFGKPRATPPR